MQNNIPQTDLYTTVKQKKLDYPGFIIHANTRAKHTHVLLNLYYLQEHYISHKISDSLYAEPNTFSNKNSLDWTFELYKMKKSIFANREHTFNNKITPTLTKQANQVFLLAMVYGHTQIVSYFLSSNLININQSIFGTKFWPSYFLLACSCEPSILNEFKRFRVDHRIAWAGLTPTIITYLSSNTSEKRSDFDFISYQQYQLINEYMGYKLINSIDPVPVFLLDFACILSDGNKIKSILDENPEAGNLSRLSFIVQNEEHLILMLSRYGFRNEQHFNGLTPLHYSCLNSNLLTLTLLLYIDFPIRQDNSGKFPNEVGPHKVREKASIFFNFCAGVSLRNSPYEKYTRIFSNALFKESLPKWMGLLKFHQKDHDKYIGIFRYLDFNKDNKIVNRSRFNIINAFSLSKTPSSVEACVKKLIFYPFKIIKFTRNEASQLYNE